MAQRQRGAAGLVSAMLAVVLVGAAAPSATAAEPPVITAVTPGIVTAGTAVTVTGTGLVGVTGSTEVLLNGTPVAPSSVSGTAVELVVPPTATSGPVVVRTGDGEAVSATDLFVAPSGTATAQVLHTSRLADTVPTVVTLPTANGVGLLTVPLDAGQRLALRLSAGSFGTSTSAARVSVTRPDGTPLLAATGFSNSGLWVDPLTATVAGTYTVLVDPQGTVTGKVTVEAFVVPDDVTEPVTAGGAPVALTVAAPGQNASVSFAGTAGQRIALNLTGSTFPTTSSTALRVNRPDGAALVSTSFSAATTFVDAVTLPVDGTYTVAVNPAGAATGGVQVQVLDATGPLTDVMADGSSVSVATTVAGQNAALRFPLSAGDRVAVQVVEHTYGTASSALRTSVVGPSGATVIAATNSPKGTFLEPVAVAADGLYQVVLDPSTTLTGSASVRIYVVPADVTVPGEIGAGPVQVEVGTPGQNAAVTFTGVAGQRVALNLTGSTVPTSSTVRLNKPDGTALVTTSLSGATAFLDAVTLPVDGTYALTVNPSAAGTGAVTVEVLDATVPVTEIAADGSLVAATTTVPGQNAALRFPLAAGQRIAVQVVDTTFGTSSSAVKVSVLGPTGATVVAATNAPKGAFLEPVTVAADGPHQLVVDPTGLLTGTLSVRVFTVPADPSVPATVGGGPVTVEAAVPGQNPSVPFTGVAGQRVALALAGSTFPTSAATAVRVNKPDGTALVSTSYAAASFFQDVMTLPVDGTYTVVLNPAGAVTGSVSVELLDATVLVTDVVADGSAVSVATTVAGQNAALRFPLTAGERVAVQVVDHTYGTASTALKVSLVGPTGTALVAATNAPKGTFLEPVVATADGLYQVVLDPSTTLTGSASVRVFTVPADVSLPVEPGADPVTLTIDTPGQNAAVTFAGTAGQRVALNLTGSTFSSATSTALRVNRPDGTALVSTSFSAATTFVDAVTLPVDGTYTVVVNPAGVVTGSVAVALLDASVVPTDVVADGSSVTVATTVAGQNAALRFPLSAGDRVAVQVVEHTYGTASSALRTSVVGPSGATVIAATNSPKGTFLEPVAVAADGLYQVVLDPSTTLTGSASVRVFTVPADVTVPGEIGAGPVQVEVGTPGQNAAVTFTGTTGQRVAVNLTGSTLSTATTLRLNKPDGTALVTTSYSAATAFLDTMTLPVDGVYTLVVNPGAAGTGAVTVEVLDTAMPVTDVLADGSLVEASTSVGGQSAALRFPMTAGQRVAVQVVDHTYGTASSAVKVSLVGPGGATLVAATNAPKGTFLEPVTATVEGLHQLVVDPGGQATGTISVRIFTVPADPVVATTIGGGTVPVGVTAPGQNASVTFDAAAGQRVALSLTGSTFTSGTSVGLRLNRPDGTAVASTSFSSATAFVDAVTLPSDGTYTVVLNPPGVLTGTLDLEVLDATIAVTDVAADGTLVTAATTVPGQNAALRFPLLAGERVAVQVVGQTYGTSSSALRASVVGPTGATLVAATNAPAGAFLEPVAAPADGLYQVVLDPSAMLTGTASVRVHTVPADVSIPTAVGDGPVDLTVTAPGQNAALTFTGTAGQRVALGVSGSTFPTTTSTGLRLTSPTGAAVVSTSFSAASAFVDAVTLPVDGVYTVLINPAGAAVGTVSVEVLDAAVPTVDVLADGSLVEATTTVAGQNLALRFPLAAGERFAVQVVDTTFGTTSSAVKISATGPTGATVLSATNAPKGTFVEPITVSADGTYRLVIDPTVQAVGTLTVRIFTVPADVVVPTAAGAGPVDLTVGTPGQTASATFDGVAGQRVAVRLSGSTFSTATATSLRVLGPTGTALTTTSFSAATAFVDTLVLPADGTYTVVVNPSGVVTGTVVAEVLDTSVVVVEGIPDGKIIGVRTDIPGQDAVVRFPLTAGDRVAVELVDSTYSSAASGLRLGLRTPAGGWLMTPNWAATGTFVEPETAPADGTYELSVDPSGALTGNLILKIHRSRVADVPTAIGADPVTVTVGTPGQAASASFDGIAGQRVVASVTGSTLGSGTDLRLIAADGTWSRAMSFSGGTGFVDTAVLPSDGRYSVAVDPRGATLGSARIQVLEAPADATGVLTVDGTPVRTTLVGPGQDLRLSAHLSAGVTYGLHVAQPDGPTTLALAAVDGTWSRSLSFDGTAADWSFAPTVSGEFVLTVNPTSAVTGDVVADLYSAVSTPRVTVDGLQTNGWVGSTSVSASWAVSQSGHALAGYGVVVDDSPSTVPEASVTQTRSAWSAELAEGVHWLHVRAITADGIAGPVVHQRIGVDVSAPQIAGLTSTTHPDPEVLYAGAQIDVVWDRPEDVSGIAGYSVAVSQSAFAEVDGTIDQTTTSVQAQAVTDGDWYVRVRPVDGAGNVGDVVTLATTVDLDAPAAPVVSTSHDAGASSGRTLLATFASGDGAEVEDWAVVLDAEAGTVPDGSATTREPQFAAAVPTGVSWLHVRARDALGRWGGTSHVRIEVVADDVVVDEPAHRAFWRSSTIAIRCIDGADGLRLATVSAAGEVREVAPVEQTSDTGSCSAAWDVPGMTDGARTWPDGEYELVVVDGAGAAVSESVAVSVASTLDPSQRIERDYAVGLLSAAERAELLLTAVLAPGSLPEQYRGAAVDAPDITAVLKAWQAADDATRERLAALLTPQDESGPAARRAQGDCGGVWSVFGDPFDCRVETDHFAVYYRSGDVGPTSTGAARADWVQLMLDALEHARDTYEDMGFRVEDGLVDVVLDAGFADRQGLSIPSLLHWTRPMIVMDSDTRIGAYLPEHELFHQVQYQYISARDVTHVWRSPYWWMEATAEWAANVAQKAAAAPGVRSESYARELKTFLDNSRGAFNEGNIVESGGSEYGAFLLAEFLEEKADPLGNGQKKGAAAIEAMWEGIGSGFFVHDPVEVMSDLLENEWDQTYAQGITEFRTWSYVLGRRTNGIGFADPESGQGYAWRSAVGGMSYRPPHEGHQLGAMPTEGTTSLAGGGAYFLELENAASASGVVTVQIDPTGPATVAAFATDAFPGACGPVQTAQSSAYPVEVQVTVTPDCPDVVVALVDTSQPDASRMRTVDWTASYAPSGVVLDNGTIEIGLTQDGSLISDGVGLRRSSRPSTEVLAEGCECEGWGIATSTASSGYVYSTGVFQGLERESFDVSATEATTVHRMGDSLEITHHVHPSATDDMFQVDVTVRRIGVDMGFDRVHYRRAIDFDVNPTPFDEYISWVKAPGGDDGYVTFLSNDGFAYPDPAGPVTDRGSTGYVERYGPEDQGGLIDLDLGFVDPLHPVTFTLYFGLSTTRADAEVAAATVGADLYLLAEPNAERSSSQAAAIFAVRGDDLPDSPGGIASRRAQPFGTTTLSVPGREVDQTGSTP